MSTSPPLVVADRYRLVEPLGQGGMGRVWRATDVVLHREVAIKELVPPPGLTPEERREMRERSLREARAIARLNNINVVRVFDVLRTDADPWIVMEYVPSRSLQDTLAAEGPVPVARAAEIGLGVLNALRAAHRNGVVHRDVKPGNVLLGSEGRVVLTDFGLATVPGDPNVTRTGLVLGSPAYIAPERARDGTAGPAADLWSLGATLYAAVEGASPFARPTAIATLSALATENVPPARNAGQLKPALNGLLRKDPTHRINADEAERLLLRATGRRSRMAFPMSPTMRRPGAGRDRSGQPTGTPPTPMSGSAPVVPGPRPPVSTGRPPANPVFTPGKATVGRPARADDPKTEPPRLDATRVDTPPVRERGHSTDKGKTISGTDAASPKAPGRRGDEAASPPASTSAKGAPAHGSKGTYGIIPAADRQAEEQRESHISESSRGAVSEATPENLKRPQTGDPATAAPDTAAQSAAAAAARSAAAAKGERRAADAGNVGDARASSAPAEAPGAPGPSAPAGKAARTAGGAIPDVQPTPEAPVSKDVPESRVPESRAPDGGPSESAIPDGQAVEGGTPGNQGRRGVTAVGGPDSDASESGHSGSAAPDGQVVESGTPGNQGRRGVTAQGGSDSDASESGHSGSAAPDGRAADSSTLASRAGQGGTAEGGAPESDALETGVPTGGAPTGGAPTSGIQASGIQAGGIQAGGAQDTGGAPDSDAAPSSGVEVDQPTPAVADNPAVGARAGAAGSQASRQKGLSQTTAAAGAGADATATAVTSMDVAAAAADAEPAGTAPDAGSATDQDVRAAEAPESRGNPPESRGNRVAEAARAMGGKVAEAARSLGGKATRPEDAPEAPPTADTATADAAETAEPAGEAADAAQPPGRDINATVMELPTPAAEEGPAAGKQGTTTPKRVAAARTAERKVTTAPVSEPTGPVPADSTPGAPPATAPATRNTDSRAGFAAPRRPAWQPMSVPRREQPKPGVTVLGTTLTRGQTATGIAVVLAVLLALVLLLPRAFDGGGNEDPQAGGQAPATPKASAVPTPSASAPAAPPTTTKPPTSAPAKPAAPALPAGWYLYTDPTGFSVPLPNGVRAGGGSNERQFRWRNRLLIIAQTDRPQPDPYRDWQQQERDRAGDQYRDYRRVSLKRVDYFQSAADWEFTYTTSSGNAQHALKRNFLTSKTQAYSINWYTSPGDWNAAKKDIQAIHQGFKPKG